MARIAFLDLPSGLSGDMFLGCLIDAGWSLQALQETIGALGLSPDEWSLQVEPVMKGPFLATQVRVQAMEGHKTRHLAEIRGILEASRLDPAIQTRALAVFTRLAHAEARVHGASPETIHFHEVGAVDALIDIVGTVAGLAALGITQLYASALPLGRGWVQTAHGMIPLPAPATLELLAAVNAPTHPAPGPGEWLTPTGAALLAEFARFEQPLIQLERIGVGAGVKNPPWPNVARIWLGNAVGRGAFVTLETNIDDMNPQLYGAVSEKLFAAGARDVWFTPIQMKKNRPGTLLSVLGAAEAQESLARIMLQETTTLGVRIGQVDRRIEAQRRMEKVSTPWGPVAVKLKILEGQILGAVPEFEDCQALARSTGVPVRQVLEAAAVAAHMHCNENKWIS